MNVIGQTRIPAYTTNRYFHDMNELVMAVIPYPKKIPKGTAS